MRIDHSAPRAASRDFSDSPGFENAFPLAARNLASGAKDAARPLGVNGPRPPPERGVFTR